MNAVFEKNLVFLVLCVFALILLIPYPSHAEWMIREQEGLKGSKCVIFTWSVYQEPSPIKRDRSSVRIVVEGFDPLQLSFEIDSGISTSLKIGGALKIGNDVFLLEFDGRIGKLKDQAENLQLINALRAGKDKILFGFGQREEKMVFDQFLIKDLDQILSKVSSKCSFKV